MENKMAILQVNGDPVNATSTRNNGGAGVNTQSSSVLSNSVSLGFADVGVFGSVVVDGTDTDKAVDSSNFANSTQRPIAKRLTSELGGVNNLVLLSGAAQPHLVQSVNKLETILTLLQTTAYRDGRWNIFTGKYDSGYPLTSEDDFLADTEARASRTAPGNFSYKGGNPVPVSESYPVKTA